MKNFISGDIFWVFPAKQLHCVVQIEHFDQSYKDFILEAVIPVLNTSICKPLVWAKYPTAVSTSSTRSLRRIEVHKRTKLKKCLLFEQTSMTNIIYCKFALRYIEL